MCVWGGGLYSVTTVHFPDACSHHSAAKVLRSCPTLCNPIDCSLPGSPVHGILQARILEGISMPSSRGSSGPREDVCSHHSTLHRCSPGGGWVGLFASHCPPAHLFWFLSSVCCVNTCLANPFFYPGHLFYSLQPNVTIYNLLLRNFLFIFLFQVAPY